MKTWQKIKQNPELIEQYRVREVVVDGIREFFKSEGFLEVETPLLVPQPGTEPYLEVFETALKVADGRARRAFLTTSPELQMKKLLAAGVGSCFQICKSFRNGEGVSGWHNSEFTILEWYRAGADYTEVMKDCERLMEYLVGKVEDWKRSKHQAPSSKRKSGRVLLKYQWRELDVTPPWERVSVAEAFEGYAGVGVEELLDKDAIVKKAGELGLSVNKETSWEEAYNQIFLNKVEPELSKLDRPVIVYDYPASQAALSRKKGDDPRFAERFEWYLGGLELGNAFSELTDWQEQEARMKADLEERKKLGKTEYGIDEDFIEALRVGMPETSGIAVGVDRLAMLLADAASIDEVLWFPGREVFEL